MSKRSLRTKRVKRTKRMKRKYIKKSTFKRSLRKKTMKRRKSMKRRNYRKTMKGGVMSLRGKKLGRFSSNRSNLIEHDLQEIFDEALREGKLSSNSTPPTEDEIQHIYDAMPEKINKRKGEEYMDHYSIGEREIHKRLKKLKHDSFKHREIEEERVRQRQTVQGKKVERRNEDIRIGRIGRVDTGFSVPGSEVQESNPLGGDWGEDEVGDGKDE